MCIICVSIALPFICFQIFKNTYITHTHIYICMRVHIIYIYIFIYLKKEGRACDCGIQDLGLKKQKTKIDLFQLFGLVICFGF